MLIVLNYGKKRKLLLQMYKNTPITIMKEISIPYSGLKKGGRYLKGALNTEITTVFQDFSL